jgi:hypothetical protein
MMFVSLPLIARDVNDVSPDFTGIVSNDVKLLSIKGFEMGSSRAGAVIASKLSNSKITGKYDFGLILLRLVTIAERQK